MSLWKKRKPVEGIFYVAGIICNRAEHWNWFPCPEILLSFWRRRKQKTLKKNSLCIEVVFCNMKNKLNQNIIKKNSLRLSLRSFLKTSLNGNWSNGVFTLSLYFFSLFDSYFIICFRETFLKFRKTI